MEFCTYFDRKYLCQGVALYQSLLRHGQEDALWVLCLDDETRLVLTALGADSLRIVTVAELQVFESRLVNAQRDRSPVEFYYACTASLVKYVMHSTGSTVTYIDADVLFFAPTTYLLEAFKGNDVAILEHLSSDPEAEDLHGRYNVSVVYFSGSSEAKDCLEWWAEQTLRSTRLGDGVWGDQKYLDEFPSRFAGVGAFSTPDIAGAPWNVWRYDSVMTPDGRTTLGEETLVCYHFARFAMLSRHLFVPIRRDYVPRSVMTTVYRRYMIAMREAFDTIRKLSPSFRIGYTRWNISGVLLGVLYGRTYYEGRAGLVRLGPYLPSSRVELANFRRRRLHPRRRGHLERR